MTGEEIRRQREKHGLSQVELAEALDTTHTRISEWENGKNMRGVTRKAFEYYFELLEMKAKLRSITSR